MSGRGWRPRVPAEATHWAGGRPGCFQVALTCTQIWWTTEVGLAFARLEEGYENAIKDYNKKQVCGPGATRNTPGHAGGHRFRRPEASDPGNPCSPNWEGPPHEYGPFTSYLEIIKCYREPFFKKKIPG